jgi:Tol biopolymer transport system component
MVQRQNIVVVMDLTVGSERQVTGKGYSDSSPSFSPDDSHLYVASRRWPPREGDRAELMRLDVSGGDRETVFSWDRDIVNPSVSADGTVAFMSYVEGDWEVFTLDIGADEVSQLTDNQYDDIDPRISNDGTTIVFASNRNGNFDIYEIRKGGSGETRITDNPAADIMPSYSPNRTSIVFVSYRKGNEEIYMKSADGTPAQLTNYHGKDMAPRLSPGSKTMAFASSRGSSYIQINLMDLTREIGRTELLEYLENLEEISWQ